MPINKFNPEIVSPGEDNYEALELEWLRNKKARIFGAFGITWQQSSDSRGIFFVPHGKGQTGEDMYDNTSLSR